MTEGYFPAIFKISNENERAHELKTAGVVIMRQY